MWFYNGPTKVISNITFPTGYRELVYEPSNSFDNCIKRWPSVLHSFSHKVIVGTSYICWSTSIFSLLPLLVSWCGENNSSGKSFVKKKTFWWSVNFCYIEAEKRLGFLEKNKALSACLGNLNSVEIWSNSVLRFHSYLSTINKVHINDSKNVCSFFMIFRLAPFIPRLIHERVKWPLWRNFDPSRVKKSFSPELGPRNSIHILVLDWAEKWYDRLCQWQQV